MASGKAKLMGGKPITAEIAVVSNNNVYFKKVYHFKPKTKYQAFPYKITLHLVLLISCPSNYLICVRHFK